jgi:hypothetical protein
LRRELWRELCLTLRRELWVACCEEGGSLCRENDQATWSRICRFRRPRMAVPPRIRSGLMA